MIAYTVPLSSEFVLVGAILLITLLPMWMICDKAGFPGWISLATLVPVLNILLLFFLAFTQWPALRRTSSGKAIDT